MKRLLLFFALLPLMLQGQHYVVRHYSVEDGLIQNTVMAILQDKQGFMWFGTWDGLSKFDGMEFTSYKSHPGDGSEMYNNRIMALWQDENDYICVENYDEQVFRLEGDKFVHIGNSSIVPKSVRARDSIYIDQHGIIWAADNEAGIKRCREGRWERLTPPVDNRIAHQLRRHFIVLEDSTGNVWVNPTGGGFSRYNFEKDELEWPLKGIVSNMIHAAYLDRQGLLWLSTYDRGIDCIDLTPQPFQFVDVRSDESETGEVRALIELQQEGIFIGGEKLKAFNKDERMIYCALENEGQLLLGTKGHGILGTDNVIPLNCNDVYDMVTDHKFLYVGTYGGGITVVDLQNKQQHRAEGYKVRQLLLTDSLLYAATTRGLWIGERFSDREVLIPFYDVRCLAQDPKGQIWVGSFGGGLNRLVGEGLECSLEPVEKNVGIVVAMAVDTVGCIWCASEHEMCCYNPVTGAFQQYDVLAGKNSPSFTEAKAIRLNDGDLVFGYTEGYCRFSPYDITHTTSMEPVVVTRIENPTRDAVTIHFATLDFLNPRRIQYAYRMKGYDKDWVNAGSRRWATYTNLRPGKYTFQVRSTNSEGVWIDNEYTTVIRIRPNFWQSGWAIALYVLLAIAILYGIYYFIKANTVLRREVQVEQKVTDIKLRFFTNISHELRTPLTLIIAPVENILNNERISPSVREQLELVRNNSQRMLRLVNQLLDFRKIQNKKMRLKIRQVHLYPLIKDICANFNKEAYDKQINLTSVNEVQNDLAWVDRERVDTILYNLLSNAFKFTGEGKNITVSLKEKHGYLLLRVEDEGVGIPMEKRSLLFERFSSHDAIKNPSDIPGTGIGLNLVKELVDLHHGYIEVESEVGKGTRFTIFLHPDKEHFGNDVDIIVDDADARSDAQSMANAVSLPEVGDGNMGGKRTILVVDDNEDMRRFLSSILAPKYNIRMAGDGVEALKSIQEEVPDMIITDLMMPNMDGIELLQHVKKAEETSFIPIILLTAKSAIESRLEALGEGADDYVTKPFEPEYIKARVKNIFRQREQLEESYRNRLLKLEPQKTNRDEPNDAFLMRLMTVMEKQMDNNALTVDELVDEVGMGRTVFFNRLKGLTGLSPVEFIREMRIKRAAQLLENGGYNVTEVTYMVGMNDSRYFSKCFKASYGMTPTEYRHAKQKNSEKKA